MICSQHRTTIKVDLIVSVAFLRAFSPTAAKKNQMETVKWPKDAHDNTLAMIDEQIAWVTDDTVRDELKHRRALLVRARAFALANPELDAIERSSAAIASASEFTPLARGVDRLDAPISAAQLACMRSANRASDALVL